MLLATLVFFLDTEMVFSLNKLFFSMDSKYNPYSVAINDFSDDSYLDIATVDYNYNYLDIILTHKSYSFRNQISYATTGLDSYPESVYLADFDNDNQLDMVVANSWTNDIIVFLRYNNNTFSNQQRYSTGSSSNPTNVISGDFNNDNHLDIAVVNYGTNTMGIFLNYGNGIFLSQTTYSTGSNSQSFALTSDYFNNDQWIDIVVVNYQTGNICIFLGQGDESFINQIIYSTNRNAQPYDIIVNDFNNDNCTDIAVVNYAMNSISVFIGLCDVNGDKLHDIIVANYDSNTIGILYGYGNDSCKLNIIMSTGSSSGPFRIRVADINNDTLPDILVTNYLSNNIGIFFDQVNNSLSTQMIYSTGSNSNPYSIAVGDINQDGYFDIVVANYGTSSTGTNSYPYSVAIGDFNDDLILDIVVANSGSNDIGIFIGFDDGTFSSWATYSTGADPKPYAVALGDLNSDDKLDIVVTNYGGDTTGIFQGFGNGSFVNQRAVVIEEYCAPRSVVLNDLNNDGHLDIVIGCYDTESVAIFLGYGNSTLEITVENV
ncbi:unnamed protein product [Adineta ricciae]|uniref:Uncharacterized protein n=1 Tax=Adineta ricciae TaxID=249248 RepID=A0A814JW39_ADIRI|nr:unnamed protein product [Adineta ricciae]CAF1661426.1 unnamed protein product [Adineta ricciae]